MRKLTWPIWWTTIIAVTIALIGFLFAWTMDRRSLERANRLYRKGAAQEAALLYADRVGHDPTSAQLRYNLGTALLTLRSDKAGEELTRASTATNQEVRARALYNLGLWYLTRALDADGVDSAKASALRSVAAYKNLLRLQPGRADAGWNLAIALRVIASADAESRPGNLTSAKGRAARDSARILTADRPPNVKQVEDTHDVPRTGARETAAPPGAVASVSLSEAAQVLGTAHRDPAIMVRKLMASEGRALRRHATERSAEERR